MINHGESQPKIAFQFPGQGSQQVGMGKALAGHFPIARQTFEEADDVLGFSLSRLCFDGPTDTLTETVNAQPAILTTSIAALRALQYAANGAVTPTCLAGHSLGEYSALVAAEALSFADALRLVRLRGELMSLAGQANPGGMAAVLGLESDAVEEICRRASEKSGIVQVANDNAPGQVVISGDAQALERATELAKAAGARRVIRLAVSIAAHSGLMVQAAEGLRRAIEAIHLRPPSPPVIGNVEVRSLRDAADVQQELVTQLTAPVRWKDTIRHLVHLGVTHFVEIGPGNVLSGLLSRIEGETRAIAVGDPESLAVFCQTFLST
jgi:[acyl-carrier-protein] S-malonyltransferase